MDVADKLQHYRRKRDFRQTAEPRGRTVGAAAGRSFVIQRHEARRLHFDFRLELGGVLKSWAVPKQPSMTPGEKRLAVHVEDHPLEYGDFEGVIPKGEYGGGNVEIWDRGEWIPERDADSDYRRGRLSFRLDGERLSGSWSLVRMGKRSGGGKDNWLLIKRRDADGVEPRSVRRQTVHRSRTGPLRVWRSNRRSGREAHVIAASRIEGARAARMPTRVAPQLAQLVAAPPEDDGWIHEMKLDGYRIFARRSRDAVQLDSRRGEDWTARFDSVARAVAELPVDDAILDGEVVLPDRRGVPDFQALQNVFSEGRTNEVVYYVFDLLYLDGYDLTGATLVDRKAALARLLRSAPAPRIRLSDHVRGHAAEFFQEACKAGLEGIVSKRATDPYRPGRGSSWLKTKCRARQELVIAGYTDPAGARKGF
ncbi:MAG TPA: non-homologous end-joining DNA ligase, partial [Candidatus Binatia bacterium]|nr:non-homologous end-joining DNA ligase [Candidatus Binatia bacterium]